jgi:hypothetical protein
MGRDITMTDRYQTDRYHDRPFPADDDESRATSHYPKKNDSDPLAELARLIGQNDPFGNGGRAEPSPPTAPPSRATDFRMSRGAPVIEDEPPPQMPAWMQHRQTPRAPEPAPRAPEPDFTRPPDFSRPPSFMAAAAPRAAEPAGYERSAPPLGAMDRGVPQQGQLELGQPDRLKFEPYVEPQFDPLPASSAPFEQERYDDALYGQLPAEMAPPGAYSDASYGYDDGYGEPADPRALKPRRNNMLTVVAVLTLAVVGTGGALAYRTFTSGPRSGEPPIIKADNSPTKIPGPSSDNSGKPIQDRLASGGGVETLVSREEQPAADPSRMPGSGPRVVMPPLNQNPNPPGVASVAPGPKPNFPPPNNGTLAGDEPRKIKTFSIHPDQADSAAQPVAVAAPPSTRPAARSPAAAPARPAARSVEDANASASNAPLSLSPGAAEAPAPRPQRVASLPAEQPATAGGYVVQVSSQRSEADAKASYRTLQGKFASVLGSQPSTIKRVDLGNKGVYYRAMVGPFASAEQAQQICGNLKSAGGQCFVQRN